MTPQPPDITASSFTMSNNSSRAHLTTASLAAHTAASNTTAPASNSGDHILKAALDLGFEMPSGWQGSRTYGQLPMERYLNERDDLVAVNVPVEDGQGKGSQKPNL